MKKAILALVIICCTCAVQATTPTLRQIATIDLPGALG
jgi:hypothetical protein